MTAVSADLADFADLAHSLQRQAQRPLGEIKCQSHQYSTESDTVEFALLSLVHVGHDGENGEKASPASPGGVPERPAG